MLEQQYDTFHNGSWVHLTVNGKLNLHALDTIPIHNISLPLNPTPTFCSIMLRGRVSLLCLGQRRGGVLGLHSPPN